MPIDHVLRVLERTARAQRGPLSVLALAALALGALGTTDVLTHVSRTQEETVRDAWREEGSFTYRVPVDGGVGAYPEGTVLPMGEPGYLTPVGPRVLLEFSWRAIDPPRPVLASRVELVAHSRGLGAGGQAWEVAYPLGNASAQGEDAGALRVDAVLDWALLDAATAQAARKDVPTTEWRVLATLKRDMPDGGDAQVSEFVFPILYERPLYVLPSEQDARHQRDHGERVVILHETPATVEDLARAPQSPLLVVAGLGVLALVARLREDPPAARRRSEP